MSASLPHGVSALRDPLDEPYLALLVACAAIRRRLGLRAQPPHELERALDSPLTAGHGCALSANVVPFPVRRRPRSYRRKRYPASGAKPTLRSASTPGNWS